MTIDELLASEEIKKLRVRYGHYLDGCNADGLASLFTEDAVCNFGSYGLWTGREEIRRNYRDTMARLYNNIPYGAVHANTNHWVELTGPDSAVGRAYLIDLAPRVGAEKLPLTWVGLYDEEYRKIGGKWLIFRSSLQFFWPQRALSEGFGAEFPPG